MIASLAKQKGLGNGGMSAVVKSRSSRTGRRRSRGLWLLILVIVVLLVAALAYGPGLVATAQAGTAYTARVGCSCRFVAGRALDDCQKDKLAGMDLITLTEDAEAQSVTARFPLIAADTARFRKGYGCVLDSWED